MSAQQNEMDSLVEIEGIGGIDEDEIPLTKGVNVLTGPNSANKTSTLRAIAAALGSEDVPLKSDREEGRVRIKFDNETEGESEYTRTVRIEDGQKEISGNPYEESNGASTSELFAFLLESNEARRAIREGRDLRDIIMEPVDTDEIEREISQLLDEREEIKKEVERLEAKREELPELRKQKEEIENEIESKKDEISSLEDKIKSSEKEIDETKERREELREKVSEVESLRSEAEETRDRIESEQKSIEKLKEEAREIESEIEEKEEPDRERIDEIEDEIERLETLRSEKNRTLSQLQDIVEFNEHMLDSDSDRGAVKELHDKDSSLFDDEVTCWTCGSEVPKQDVEDTVESIKELRREKNEEINQIDQDIEELRYEKEDIEERAAELEDLETELNRRRDEISEREKRIKSLKQEIESMEDEVKDMEEEIEELEKETEEEPEVLELHKKRKEREVELESLKDELENIEADIEESERASEEVEMKNERIENLNAQIKELRNRVDRIENDAVEGFNAQMEEILDLLEYENLERVWIERKETEEKVGRRKEKQKVFELNIVREKEDGTVYNDSLKNMSESEKEVVGLVFALSGYLAHEVYEEVPFMLLDSLGSLDADRTCKLLDHFSQYPEYMVAAVLPGIEEEMGDGYHRIDMEA